MRKNDESARFPPRKIDRACEKIREYDRWPADGMSLAGEKMERLARKYLAAEANLSFHVGVYLLVYLRAKLFSHLTRMRPSKSGWKSLFVRNSVVLGESLEKMSPTIVCRAGYCSNVTKNRVRMNPTRSAYSSHLPNGARS